MTNELEMLEEQVEKLRNAVDILTAGPYPPQERLDRALSYYVRTFREPPEGEARSHYESVYEAIGDPPVGTTIHVVYEQLSDDELATIHAGLDALLAIMEGRLGEARDRAAAAGPVAETSAIPEGRLDSLVPGRAHGEA
jgi:hypothetical protein